LAHRLTWYARFTRRQRTFAAFLTGARLVSLVEMLPCSFTPDLNERMSPLLQLLSRLGGQVSRPAPTINKSDPYTRGSYWKPWNGNDPPKGREHWPVCNVSAKDAEDFAQWLSNRDGVKYRLPTEEEWEYAARNGSKGTLFPWGDSWQEGFANLNSKPSPKDVGSFPQGATQAGVLDMVGNAWEWTSSKAKFYDDRPVHNAPNARVRRGGSFADIIKTSFQDATDRGWLGDEHYKFPTIGFRLVRDRQ
jgi:formylglycine-generating enzyme required for sulfatase activity